MFNNAACNFPHPYITFLEMHYPHETLKIIIEIVQHENRENINAIFNYYK